MRTPDSDPYLKAAFPLRNRVLRCAWGVVYMLLFRPSPRPMHGWRRFLLRSFGARIARHVHIYPSARIWAPWNLSCDENATIAEDVVVYNPRPLHLGSHAIVSQQAYLCGATHDYEDPAFPLIAFPATLGAYSWVCTGLRCSRTSTLVRVPYWRWPRWRPTTLIPGQCTAEFQRAKLKRG